MVLTEYNEKAVLDAIAKENRTEGQVIAFKNMIRRGFAVHDAMSLAEITEEQAREALAQMGKKQPV